MKKKAILCVDDEVIILAALKMELKNQLGDGYIYEEALDASEAHDIIEELTNDGVEVSLILTDWLMPGTKGDEFLIQVKEKHPGIRSIMITGQADEAAIKRAKDEAGVHTVLGKPWDKKELFNAINSCLKG